MGDNGCYWGRVMSRLLRIAIMQSMQAGGFVMADVFATTLYVGTGTGVNPDIVTGMDFVANDGLLWIKTRNDTQFHQLHDTVRGASKVLSSNATTAEENIPTSVTSFNSDGFSLGDYGGSNGNNDTLVAWQWIKAQGFSDVVSYVGDGIAGRTVAIDLDDGTAQFGMAIVKKLSANSQWSVQHRSLGGTEVIHLNLTNATSSQPAVWNNTDATTTVLTLGTDATANSPSENYIAYLFAHNPDKGIFCGSYTGTGASGNKVFTGFPVGWVLIKSSSSTFPWYILDATRSSGTDSKYLLADTSAAESGLTDDILFNEDGFTANNPSSFLNVSGANYIFMALAQQDWIPQVPGVAPLGLQWLTAPEPPSDRGIFLSNNMNLHSGSSGVGVHRLVFDFWIEGDTFSEGVVLLGKDGLSNDIRVTGERNIQTPVGSFNFPAQLNLFDGLTHSFFLIKTGWGFGASVAQWELTIDSYSVNSAFTQSQGNLQLIAGASAGTVRRGLKGVVKNLVFYNLNGTKEVDMPIDDGSGTVITNNGTLGDANIVNAVLGVDYQWNT